MKKIIAGNCRIAHVHCYFLLPVTGMASAETLKLDGKLLRMGPPQLHGHVWRQGALNDVVIQSDGTMLSRENDELHEMLSEAWALAGC